MKRHGLRVWSFAAVCIACLLGGGVYVATAALRQDEGGGGPTGPAAAPPAGEPVLLFVHHGTGAKDGHLAWAPVDQPAHRHVTGVSCERVYAAAERGVCLVRSGGYPPYRALDFDTRTLRSGKALPLDGIPSRARTSRDGRFASATTFVTGHSYATPGTFSTQTVLLDLERRVWLGNVEEWAISGDRGSRLDAPDVNVWGVTFADDGDTFYATVATGGKTHLMRGSVRGRTARVIRDNVECPSLSPDGARIAYKKLVGGRGDWRFHVLDLSSGKETPLAERRSVDDQLEWLDDDHVLYGDGHDIYEVRADGNGAPRRVVEGASSPVVLRP
jgi:hypothetical protein